MRSTITVRTDRALRAALEERAASQGKTVSALVRELLAEALADRPVEARAGHLKGTLSLRRRPGQAWRDRLRKRNWRA